jgi:2-desacetyl-2-hydroxyethyl bacteriochlorophyllide A dehydrogenase
MKAAVWNKTGSLDVVESAVPEPRPGQVRVRVASVGICGTDLHFYRGDFPSPAGLQPGHEIGGTIDATGEGVALIPGTAVAVEPIFGCGTCGQCLGGQYTRCPTRRLFGISAKGGMAEFLTVPATSVYQLADGADAKLGSLVEPLAVCVRGVRFARIEIGSRVAVLGGGTIGLLSAMLAVSAGASEVYVTARHPQQAEAAKSIGATVVGSGEALALAHGQGSFDCVIETVGGGAETLTEAVNLAAPGGVISMLGVFGRPASIPALAFSSKELTLVGSNCYARTGATSDFAIAVQLLERHKGALSMLVTHRFPLASVNEAFAAAADKTAGSIKVQIEP